YVVVFFSSRRRHTRFSRDWSSDVCSSDLGALTLGERHVVVAALVRELVLALPDLAADVDDLAGATDGRVVLHAVPALDHLRARRSEERRVGKGTGPGRWG